jgi:hypothetical protein
LLLRQQGNGQQGNEKEIEGEKEGKGKALHRAAIEPARKCYESRHSGLDPESSPQASKYHVSSTADAASTGMTFILFARWTNKFTSRQSLLARKQL